MVDLFFIFFLLLLLNAKLPLKSHTDAPKLAIDVIHLHLPQEIRN